MNYKKIYYSIVNYRKQNMPTGYKEKHHIIPKSIGGTDEDNNLVYLNAREHFICHYLLTKMFDIDTFEWYKMHHAFMIMKCNSDTQQRYFNSRLYESRKVNFSTVMKNEQSGEKKSQFGTRWIFNDDLKQNKKIPKDYEIPEGWKEGRKLNWDINYSCCKICGSQFIPKTKEIFCGQECKSNSRTPDFYGREKEFIELYKETHSMNKALKIMGYPGAVSNYYKWAKNIVNSL